MILDLHHSTLLYYTQLPPLLLLTPIQQAPCLISTPKHFPHYRRLTPAFHPLLICHPACIPPLLAVYSTVHYHYSRMHVNIYSLYPFLCHPFPFHDNRRLVYTTFSSFPLSDKTVPISTCSFILLWVLNTIWIISLTSSYSTSLWSLDGCNSCLAISLCIYSIYIYICVCVRVADRLIIFPYQLAHFHRFTLTDYCT